MNFRRIEKDQGDSIYLPSWGRPVELDEAAVDLCYAAVWAAAAAVGEKDPRIIYVPSRRIVQVSGPCQFDVPIGPARSRRDFVELAIRAGKLAGEAFSMSGISQTNAPLPSR